MIFEIEYTSSIMSIFSATRYWQDVGYELGKKTAYHLSVELWDTTTSEVVINTYLL